LAACKEEGVNRLVIASLMVATIVVGTAASGSPARNDDFRLSALQVAVTFDGMPTAFFRSVSGLSVEIEVVEFREGGESGAVHKLPGRVKYPNIVLSRASLARAISRSGRSASRRGSSSIRTARS
jgi:hypothetical protein